MEDKTIELLYYSRNDAYIPNTKRKINTKLFPLPNEKIIQLFSIQDKGVLKHLTYTSRIAIIEYLNSQLASIAQTIKDKYTTKQTIHNDITDLEYEVNTHIVDRFFKGEEKITEEKQKLDNLYKQEKLLKKEIEELNALQTKYIENIKYFALFDIMSEDALSIARVTDIAFNVIKQYSLHEKIV